MSGLQIAILIYLAISALSTVMLVGRYREPITPGTATLALILNGIIAALVVVLG
jgi:hypothetical protein